MFPGRMLPLFILCVICSPSVFAEIYSWTDANGTVHFSDKRPNGGPADIVVPAPSSRVPMESNLRAGEAISDTVESSEPRSRRDRGDQRRGAQKRCEEYRDRLAKIQSQLRAGYSNAAGNRLRARRRDLNGRISRECILGQGAPG